MGTRLNFNGTTEFLLYYLLSVAVVGAETGRPLALLLLLMLLLILKLLLLLAELETPVPANGA